MEIAEHRLAGCWAGLSPNIGGALIRPTLIVMHYTASGGDDPSGDVSWFLSPAAKASAHVVIGRDGTAAQVVPFDRQAWHAGTSSWRGRTNCNDHAIGIELDNWGKLFPAADGAVRSYTGASVAAAHAVELTHKHETRPAWWETFPEVQLGRAVEIVRTLLAAYPSIGEIVGHDDVAPGRKVDPGPAFPMERLRALVQRPEVSAPDRIVTADRLNARDGAGSDHAIVGQFSRGARLRSIADRPGGWLQVAGTTDDGRQVTAWVAGRYLAVA